MESKLMCQTELLDMGFNKKLIAKLLPNPILKQNPRYRRAAPMKLWSENDVKVAMQTLEFADEQVKIQKRRTSAAKAVQTKTENTVRLAEKNISEITVQRIDIDELRQKTLDSKQSWYYDLQANLLWDRCYSAYEADEETVERWMVNYIRHRLTQYDGTLENYDGKTGKDEAYSMYAVAVLEKISEVYPELADECQRQVTAKYKR